MRLLHRLISSYVTSLRRRNKFFRRFSLGIIFILSTVMVSHLDLSLGVGISSATAVEARQISFKALVEKGKQYYQAGEFTKAIEKWREAEGVFRSKGDVLNQSAVLSNLALAYQQLGNWSEANLSIENSLKLLNNLSASHVKSLRAEAFNIQGSILISQGKTQQALDSWIAAGNIYQKVKNNAGYIRSLLNQSQALRAMGLYPRAKSSLEQVNQSLQQEPPSLLKAASLLNFGDTLRLMGDLQTSHKVLLESLAIAEKLDSQNDIASASLSLGNNARDRELPEEAFKYYQRAIISATSPIDKVRSQLNQLRLLIDMQKWQEAEDLAAQIKPQIQSLPISRTAIYTKVNFVQSLTRIKDNKQDTKQHNNWENNYSAKLLGLAVREAQTIEDSRAESYALGYLGELYEKSQQLSDARKLTEKALILAQITNANDIAYRWQWQLGRLLKKQNQIDEAITAYSESVKTLDLIRNDLVANNVDVQFSFRESVEPVYRELVGLLLQPQSTENSKSGKQQEKVNQSNLQKARKIIESLQLAELDNYFREACLTNSPTQIDKIDPQAAVIYPIILPDRLEIVLSLPNQTLHHYSSAIPQGQLEKNIQQMRRSLRRTSLKKERLTTAQNLYNLLIKPAEAELQKNDIKTLAFVLDGSIKNLPMAALFDGQQYLIEKYNLALTPGLQLFAPRPLEDKNLKVLVGGLSESRQGFSSLPGVKTEINQIKSEIASKVLINQTFTTKLLEKQITKTPFPVVHLATHGQFSSNAKDTFVLTWDNRINVKQLGQLLQNRDTYSKNPIELLVLSACQTAEGDKRAALGLAGVAVRSGARSTLASLWAVDDQSTSAFMVEFYKQLSQPNMSKAQALRKAQISLIKQSGFKHPFYWAPFVLIGNWL
ncbi:TPR repeat protein [Calothrix parasitica NIES-267]|uniref:TPR repeat protein n=1 Tax=Calothrix parasitica NIES-267 TaxID=1973488 RepID=A0A1Z4LQ29_9CYAN|nr:TPR repeat protein [Calothrix parasitica NIES-267]